MSLQSSALAVFGGTGTTFCSLGVTSDAYLLPHPVLILRSNFGNTRYFIVISLICLNLS